ncbi:MAG: hypothetical protein J1E65_03430 [Lachnospiraceae bacterium]|nr:hypothetical protein [Lachnospiraceae bacterium]
MTKYEFYKQIASILSPNNSEALFDYIIHSMDNDGFFLRSRYCYSNKPLPDSLLYRDVQITLAALRAPFAFESNTNYYEDRDGIIKSTVLKMELFLIDLSDVRAFENAISDQTKIPF